MFYLVLLFFVLSSSDYIQPPEFCTLIFPLKLFLLDVHCSRIYYYRRCQGATTVGVGQLNRRWGHKRNTGT